MTKASTTWWSSTTKQASGPSVGRIDGEAFCYLTTKGRRTGRPHTIEIWFAASPSGSTLYLLAGGRTDWVRNLVADPEVSVRVGRSGADLPGTARVLETGDDEDAVARRLVLQKYAAPGSSELDGWGRSALAVAVDLRGS